MTGLLGFLQTGGFATSGLSFLLDASAKGAAILILALVASFGLKRASASTRHLLWLLTIVSLIALPVTSLVTPSWQWRILPDGRRDATLIAKRVERLIAADEDDTANGNTTSALLAIPLGDSPDIACAIGGEPSVRHALVARASTGSDTIEPAVSGTPTTSGTLVLLRWAAWFLLAWLAGAMVVAIPCAIGTVRAWAIAKRGAPPTGRIWADLQESTGNGLFALRRVQIRLSPKVPIPMTWGVVRPVILLPAEAAQWPSDRLRMVLLHELAHIRRWDCFTQTIGQLACAIYWFNPLAWLAFRQMVLERERACDDAVVIAGPKPSAYADQLLEIVRSLRLSRCGVAGGVAMARRSQIEGRLLAILDAARKRGHLTKQGLAVGLFALVTVTAPLGTMRLAARAQQETVPDNDVTPSDATKRGTSPGRLESVESHPVGRWESVDFVQRVDDFRPGHKTWKGDLVLKELRCESNGKTSLGWTWKNGWMMHSNGRTRARYYIKTMKGSTYLFLPWLSGDVTIRGEKPCYYVLTKVAGPRGKIGGQGKPADTKRGSSRQAPKSFQTVRPITSVDQFDDVRWKDMRNLNLSERPGLPATLTFNESTVWPGAARMPAGCYPRKLLSDVMNPGLGIRGLHREGITGKGVNVAIVDQPLYLDHPEYAGKIVAYHDVGCGSESSMHGPAVASLLVGNSCGTAPGASVYYAAAPSWTRDTAYQAKALDRIIGQNKKLTASEKIRVVSVSAAPSGPGSPFEKNRETWDKVCAPAEAAGILVLDCTQHHGFIGPCYYDATDPEDVAKCRPGLAGRPGGVLLRSFTRSVLTTDDRRTIQQGRIFVSVLRSGRSELVNTLLRRRPCTWMAVAARSYIEGNARYSF